MLFRSFLLSLLFSLNLVHLAAAQDLKFGTSTLKKTYQGAAPIVSVRYETCFKKKKNQELSVDSVKSIGDGKLLPFFLFKKTDDLSYKNDTGKKISLSEKGVFRLNFEIIQILSDERSPYTEDNRPVQYDLSKGICIYYRLTGKNKTYVLTYFKELPSIILP
jgi:hypothetical protein